MRDVTGEYAYAFDGDDRVTTVQYPTWGIVTYHYNLAGQRVNMTDPDGGRFSYTYDSIGRCQVVENPQGDKMTHGYDSLGRLTITQCASGSKTSYAYDAAKQKLLGLGNGSFIIGELLDRND